MAIIKKLLLNVPADNEGSKLNKLEACNSRHEKPTALAHIEMVNGEPHISVLESSEGGTASVFVMVVRENIDFNNSPSLGMMSTTTFNVYLGSFAKDGVVYHAFGPEPDKNGW
jgi:hypothetical protein